MHKASSSICDWNPTVFFSFLVSPLVVDSWYFLMDDDVPSSQPSPVDFNKLKKKKVWMSWREHRRDTDHTKAYKLSMSWNTIHGSKNFLFLFFLRNNLNSLLKIYFFKSLPEDLFPLILEKEGGGRWRGWGGWRERERERETWMWERNINKLFPVGTQQGIELAL